MDLGLPDLGLLIALGISVALQELALLLRSQERSAWWASNGRDVANALAVLLATVAIRWQGAPWHVALLLAATWTLWISALARALYGRVAHPWVVVGAVGFVLAIPLLGWGRQVFAGASALLSWLF